MAGLNLVAGPPSPAEEPFPRAATRTGFPSVAKLNPPQTDSLTEMKAFPTVKGKSGDVPSPERSSEEKSSEPAKHHITPPPHLYAVHGD